MLLQLKKPFVSLHEPCFPGQLCRCGLSVLAAVCAVQLCLMMSSKVTHEATTGHVCGYASLRWGQRETDFRSSVHRKNRQDFVSPPDVSRNANVQESFLWYISSFCVRARIRDSDSSNLHGRTCHFCYCSSGVWGTCAHSTALLICLPRFHLVSQNHPTCQRNFSPLEISFC